MNSWLDKLDVLNNISHDWINIAREEIKNNTKASIPEMAKAYNELWSSLREGLKENKEITKSLFIETVGNAGEWILRDVEESLKIYFAFSHLRKLETHKRTKEVIQVIDYLMENAVTYYDPHFSNDYYRLKYENRSQIVDNARALDALVTYYVGHHYTFKAIKEDVKEETGLSDSSCVYIAEKINESYQVLQMNFIMNMMSAQQED